MTNCSLQPPMPWSAATAATAKCKRQFIGFARRRISTTVSPWTCSAIPKRRTELKLLKPSTTSERAKKVPLMMLKTLYFSYTHLPREFDKKQAIDPEHAVISRRKLLKKSSQAGVAIAATSAGLGKIEIPLRRRHHAITL